MLGLHLFAPKCIIREDIHFKAKNKLYITKHFDNGLVTLWCRDYKNKSTLRSDINLGLLTLKVWTKPKTFNLLDWDIQKGAVRLHQLLMEKIDEKDEEIDTIQVMKKNKKEKKEYTREDFVEFGKMGPKAVYAKLGKHPGQIRWADKKEVEELRAKSLDLRLKEIEQKKEEREKIREIARNLPKEKTKVFKETRIERKKEVLCRVCGVRLRSFSTGDSQLSCSLCLNTGKAVDHKKFEGRDYVREQVRIRDERTCQQCGKVWMEGQRRFDVHHLNGMCGKKSRDYDQLSSMEGLITYCHKCHINLHPVRMRISEALRKLRK